jgi:hypothetical protein
MTDLLALMAGLAQLSIIAVGGGSVAPSSPDSPWTSGQAFGMRRSGRAAPRTTARPSRAPAPPTTSAARPAGSG